MARLKDVIYLTKTKYGTLLANGKLNVGSRAITYDANNLYLIPDEETYDMVAETTATSGTIADVSVLTENDDIKVFLNNEYYYIMDREKVANHLIFTHLGYDGTNIKIKILDIVISTGSWTLTTKIVE